MYTVYCHKRKGGDMMALRTGRSSGAKNNVITAINYKQGAPLEHPVYKKLLM